MAADSEDVILEAAIIALLSSGAGIVEWRNGGDRVEHFVVDHSPFTSTVTRRLGAMAGVVYDRDGHGHDAGGETRQRRPPCVTLASDAAAQPAALAERRRAAGPSRVVIDVMELYTFAAENGAGGRAQIEAKIAAAVDVLNATLAQSQIHNVTFRLVYTGRIDRDETLNQEKLLFWLTNDAAVAKLREQHGADLVGLWAEADAAIAWVPGSFSRSLGFHVICRRYPLSLQLFSHEVAHNLGARHNAEQAGSGANDPFPFARGARTSKWMTVMSYPPDGEWRDTLPLFSNPDLTYEGQPVGIPGQADNARMIRLAAPIVADYFPSRD